MPENEALQPVNHIRYRKSAIFLIGGVLYLLFFSFGELSFPHGAFPGTECRFLPDGNIITAALSGVCMCLAAAPNLGYYIR